MACRRSEYKNAVATNDLCSAYTGSFEEQRGGVRVASTIDVAVFSNHSSVWSCVSGSDGDCKCSWSQTAASK